MRELSLACYWVNGIQIPAVFYERAWASCRKSCNGHDPILRGTSLNLVAADNTDYPGSKECDGGNDVCDNDLAYGIIVPAH